MEVDGVYQHHYKDKMLSEASSAPSKMKWLTHEIGTLSVGLPLHLSSSVFLRVDTSRLDCMKVVITGPRDTPYEDGVFVFDVYCPQEYPKVPPLVNLQTTGLGSVRFNPNLYTCGKVCLSLLGTWRGGPNEMWQEGESTLLQVFVSIQSLIFVDEPYYNEPGFEAMMGTEGGKLESDTYNETIRLGTLRWAILEQLKTPPYGFEQVVREHFTLKRVQIAKNCYKWLEEAKRSTTAGYLEQVQKLVAEIEVQLQILKPFTLQMNDKEVQKSLTQESTENGQEQHAQEERKKHADPRWNAALELQSMFPQHTSGTIYKALELNKDQTNAAVDWLLDIGEHFAQTNPDEAARVPP